jgi:hypothetical protein
LSSNTSEAAQNGITGDFDGDGRPDLAIVNDLFYVDVFLNRGGFLFTPVPINVGCVLQWSITTGDYNRDGKLDLVLTCGDHATVWSAGKFFLLLGNGDGTFQSPTTIATGVRGSITIVAGDFNKDGLLDVATGNRSYAQRDDPCSPLFHLWDSVTIVPGLGNGTFATPATFRLASKPYYSGGLDATYTNAHNALKTSDMNGDGRTDLIASPDAILYTPPPTTNRPPSLTMSSIWVGSDYGFRVTALVDEPDNDWVDFQWSNGLRVSEFCTRPLNSTTLTVTVTDARGGVANGTIDLTFPPTTTGGALPPAWTEGDIGSVAAVGSSFYGSGAWTVRGSGADVYGTSDEFHFAYTQVSGDFDVSTHVSSVENVTPGRRRV